MMEQAGMDESRPDIVESDDMLAEYRFDYRKTRPNRFAGEVAEGSLVVVLEPEIASVQDARDRQGDSTRHRRSHAASPGAEDYG